MPFFALGNPAALDAGRQMEGHKVTEGSLPEAFTSEQRFNAITALDGIWRNHSGASAPTWVTCDDPELEQALSEHYGCPIGRLNYKETGE